MATHNKSVKDFPQLPTELVEQLASFVKTEQDLSLITNQLMKQVVEKALQLLRVLCEPTSLNIQITHAQSITFNERTPWLYIITH
jgi:hypothetical protein